MTYKYDSQELKMILNMMYDFNTMNLSVKKKIFDTNVNSIFLAQPELKPQYEEFLENFAHYIPPEKKFCDIFAGQVELATLQDKLFLNGYNLLTSIYKKAPNKLLPMLHEHLKTPSKDARLLNFYAKLVGKYPQIQKEEIKANILAFKGDPISKLNACMKCLDKNQELFDAISLNMKEVLASNAQVRNHWESQLGGFPAQNRTGQFLKYHARSQS